MSLEIEAAKVIPLRVTLNRVYQGSHYQMPNRCTILTRIRKSDGVVGEIYNADEEQAQPEIVTIIREELAPMVDRDGRAGYGTHLTRSCGRRIRAAGPAGLRVGL